MPLPPSLPPSSLVTDCRGSVRATPCTCSETRAGATAGAAPPAACARRAATPARLAVRRAGGATVARREGGRGVEPGPLPALTSCEVQYRAILPNINRPAPSRKSTECMSKVGPVWFLTWGLPFHDFLILNIEGEDAEKMAEVASSALAVLQAQACLSAPPCKWAAGAGMQQLLAKAKQGAANTEAAQVRGGGGCCSWAAPRHGTTHQNSSCSCFCCSTALRRSLVVSRPFSAPAPLFCSHLVAAGRRGGSHFRPCAEPAAAAGCGDGQGQVGEGARGRGGEPGGCGMQGRGSGVYA